MKTFRDANWLQRERVMLWGSCFMAAWLCFIAVDIFMHTRAGFTDMSGEPVAHDFINYWSGAKTAWQGKPALAYDIAKFHALQNATAGHEVTRRMYSYPPVAMLLSLPLAVFSFWPALLLWTVAGVAACAAAFPREEGKKLCAIVLLAAPAGFIDIASGQNGHFSAALLAGGLMLSERKPVLAGILLGLLCYKPQLGLLLPVALLAGKNWKCFFAAAITVALVAGASYLAFGAETWAAFIKQMGVQSAVMEGAGPMWSRFPTIFGAVGLLGAGTYVCYAAQIVSTVLATIILAQVWNGKAALPVKAAAAVLAAFLATPYAWDYDMVILGFAALWVAQDAKQNPYLPFEKFTWLLVICLPLFMAPLGAFAHLPLAPVILWAALLSVSRRSRYFR